jgi:hypothetical protein
VRAPPTKEGLRVAAKKAKKKATKKKAAKKKATKKKATKKVAKKKATKKKATKKKATKKKATKKVAKKKAKKKKAGKKSKVQRTSGVLWAERFKKAVMGPWTCPKCGQIPAKLNPFYGEDERHHCPMDTCDAIVTLLSKEDLEPTSRRGSWPPQRNKKKKKR